MRYFKRLKFSRDYSLDISGEYIPCNTLSLNLNRELDGTQHNYNLRIYPSNKGGYGLAIYLAMTANNSRDILIYRENFETETDAKHAAPSVINELEKTDLKEEINEWKECNITPLFDEKFNFVGDTYTNIKTIETHADAFDYYNDNPIPKGLCGKFYSLEKSNGKLYYRDINLGYSSEISKSGSSTAVLNKLLGKLTNKKKYARFFK